MNNQLDWKLTNAVDETFQHLHCPRWTLDSMARRVVKAKTQEERVNAIAFLLVTLADKAMIASVSNSTQEELSATL